MVALSRILVLASLTPSSSLEALAAVMSWLGIRDFTETDEARNMSGAVAPINVSAPGNSSLISAVIVSNLSSSESTSDMESNLHLNGTDSHMNTINTSTSIMKVIVSANQSSPHSEQQQLLNETFSTENFTILKMAFRGNTSLNETGVASGPLALTVPTKFGKDAAYKHWEDAELEEDTASMLTASQAWQILAPGEVAFSSSILDAPENITSETSLLLRNGGSLEENDKEPQCPEGFELLPGDVFGGDQWENGYDSHASSIQECAQRCVTTPGCGSFEFSPSDKRCFRNSQTRPNVYGGYLDYVFCRRRPCPSFKTAETCAGPSVQSGWISSEVAMRPGSYCIWSGGACQAPMACTSSQCFLPDGGLPGMDLPSRYVMWIPRAQLQVLTSML